MIKRTLRYWKENGTKYTLIKIFNKLGGIFQKFILVGYYTDLRNRLKYCESVYEDAPRKAALRMIWWNFKQLFKIHVPEPQRSPEKVSAAIMKEKKRSRKELNLKDDVLNISFCVSGGLGDYLVFANYLCFLWKRYPKFYMRVDLYFSKGMQYAKLLFEDGKLCDHYYLYREADGDLNGYDVTFFISRYPEVRQYDPRKVQALFPEFFDYILLCERFYKEHKIFYMDIPSGDAQSAAYSAIKRQNRLQQPDIYGFLGISREYAYQPQLKKDEESRLADFGLKEKQYITLYYGCELAYSTSTKMWPHQYYSRLAALIKAAYPDLVLVQYGANVKISPPIENIQLNLVGKTDMEDVAILLKHSLLHIDCEGGMIHFRNALRGGKAIGLYGPTRAEFFGYDADVKLIGNGCPEACEWITGDWMLKCAAGFSEPPCMTSITPEIVMDAVHAALQEERTLYAK